MCRTELADSTRIPIARRDQVYTCGGSDRNIYVIESGQIKTLMMTARGKRCLLSIHTAGDVFGELGLLQGVRAESACVLESGVLRRVPADRFLAALAQHGLLEEYLRQLGERVLEQQRTLVDMVTLESERRLASRLVHLARHAGVPQGSRVRISARVTQEELAEMVGTTRSRVGFFLKRFREAGLVDVTQRTLVVDHRALAAYAEG
ncbi:Crp/Fnr family transcriptional regulator [Streptomyces specialis]|uniref:Crp/Fnr family transcriptional regulator n=1 Tax=Streptomyces specialis TaxID=498367 RepID=UPI00073EDE30|nr:Crp/Fnr family transcriptional regulator [Streptomyces specialis]